jgi:hypothetical protein
VTQASNQAYFDLVPKLPARRRAVYEAILRNSPHGLCIGEICQVLDWTPNRVSGRLTELARSGWIKGTKERRNRQTVWVIGDRKTIPARLRKGRKRMTGTVLGRARLFEENATEFTVRVKGWGEAPEPGEEVKLEWG